MSSSTADWYWRVTLKVPDEFQIISYRGEPEELGKQWSKTDANISYQLHLTFDLHTENLQIFSARNTQQKKNLIFKFISLSLISLISFCSPFPSSISAINNIIASKEDQKAIYILKSTTLHRSAYTLHKLYLTGLLPLARLAPLDIIKIIRPEFRKWYRSHCYHSWLCNFSTHSFMTSQVSGRLTAVTLYNCNYCRSHIVYHWSIELVARVWRTGTSFGIIEKVPIFNGISMRYEKQGGKIKKIFQGKFLWKWECRQLLPNIHWVSYSAVTENILQNLCTKVRYCRIFPLKAISDS